MATVTEDRLAGAAADLRTEMAELRADMKTENADLRTEMRTGMAQLRTEMRTGMAQLRTEMAQLRTDVEKRINIQTRWIVGWNTALAAIVIAVLR